MIPKRIGIDTSILVRLLTGLPPAEYKRCDQELSALAESRRVEVFASNQVIGEAYIVVQHHYQIPEARARSGLLRVLTSGLVAPLNGQAVIDALAAPGGPGLFDRLIANDYAHHGLETLTLDRKMASLPAARRL